jgi:hypothetical protein
MIFKALTAMAMTIALSACASTKVSGVGKSPSFRIESKDLPAETKFEVSLISLDNRKICLSLEQWPRNGEIYAREIVTLKSHDVLLPASTLDLGYCPGGCGTIEVLPGETITSSIHYSTFGPTEEIAALEDKVLLFAIGPFYCSK